MKGQYFKQPAHINPDRLHEELKAALGGDYDSLDTGVKLTRDPAEKPQLFIRIPDHAANDETTAKIEAVLTAHNPALLSKTQQKEQDGADAFEHFMGFDFSALKSMKTTEQMPVIIQLLEDIQKLMQRVNNG